MDDSRTYSFSVTGMQRGSCGRLIDQTLEETAGVHRSQTSVPAGRTVVDVDAAAVDPDILAAVIGSLGYTARRDPP